MGLFLALLLSVAPQADAAVAPKPAATGPSGRLIVLDKSAAAVEILDVAEGKVLTTIKVGDGPHEVAISPDGTTAVIGDYGGRKPGSTLRVVALGVSEVVRILDLGDPYRPHGISWESDNRHLWVTAETTGELLRVDAAAPLGESPIVARVDVGAGTAGHMVALLDDRRQFVSHIGSGMVTPVVDGKAMEPVYSGGGAEGIAVRPGGEELWVTNRADGTVCVFAIGEDGLSEKPVKRMKCEGFPIRVVFTPDGATALVSCAEAGEVELFSAEDRTSLGRVQMPLPDGAAEDASTDPIGVTVDGQGRMAYVSLSAADQIAELDIAALKVTRLIPVGRVPDGIAWFRPVKRRVAPTPSR